MFPFIAQSWHSRILKGALNLVAQETDPTEAMRKDR